jgi:dTDP-4-dehydrorhamnose reductase
VILLLGASGQVGHELARHLSAFARVTAPTSRELDLTSSDAIRAAVRERRPLLVVNAAAYTAVDAAESDAERCAEINAVAPGILAEEAHRGGAYFIHFSTDYVFDGTKTTPYVETDETNPLSVYGRTKRDGELAVAANCERYLIFRTAWVYAARGKNFALTMRRLAGERDELKVVNDQVGAPTSAAAIANGVAGVLGALKTNPELAVSASGIYHMTAGGQTTWFDFARTILAGNDRCTSLPITTAEYPTAAKRPRHSVLDNAKLVRVFGVQLPPWEHQWRAVADELRVSPPGSSPRES